MADTEDRDQRPLSALSIEARLSNFTGPIPPPAVLTAYASIDPGLVDRIVTMAESEQTHRHVLEQVSATTTAQWLVRGQIFGAALGIGTLAIAAYAVSQGQQWVAGTAIASTVGVLGVFVWREKTAAVSASDE